VFRWVLRTGVRSWKHGMCLVVFCFLQAEDGIRDWSVTGVQTCALPIFNINKQGHLTLLDSLTDSLKTNSKKNDEPTTETDPTNFSIKGIELTGNNRINVAKAAQKGSVKKTILINTLNIGEIDTQKTEQYTPIALKATIDKHSSIKTDGKIALFSKTTNAEFKSTLNAFELPDYSPIISDQIGYDIQTGQLNASANLNIKQDMLDGKTDLEINQLALVTSDAKTASKMTQQLSMPLDSALSLLRDDNDDIALSIPIKGNITSPDFNISDVINTALGNALQGTVKNYLKYALQPSGLIFMAVERSEENTSDLQSLTNIVCRLLPVKI